jgi:hypothetical protein
LISLQKEYGDRLVIIGISTSSEEQIEGILARPAKRLDVTTSISTSVSDAMNYNILAENSTDPSFIQIFTKSTAVPVAVYVGSDGVVQSLALGQDFDVLKNSVRTLIQTGSLPGSERHAAQAKFDAEQAISRIDEEIDRLSGAAISDANRSEILKLLDERERNFPALGSDNSPLLHLETLEKKYQNAPKAQIIPQLKAIRAFEDTLLAATDHPDWAVGVLGDEIDFSIQEPLDFGRMRRIMTQIESGKPSSIAMYAMTVAAWNMGDLNRARALSVKINSPDYGPLSRHFLQQALELKQNREQARLRYENGPVGNQSIPTDASQLLQQLGELCNQANETPEKYPAFQQFVRKAYLQNQDNVGIITSIASSLADMGAYLVFEPTLFLIILDRIDKLNKTSWISTSLNIERARLELMLGNKQRALELATMGLTNTSDSGQEILLLQSIVKEAQR